MISYFIIAHCTTFTTNFSIKLKSLFQVIFGQDSFPLKMSPFQVSLLQNSTNCLLANGLWNNCFHHYSFFLQKRFSSLLASTWVVVSYSYFVGLFNKIGITYNNPSACKKRWETILYGGLP